MNTLAIIASVFLVYIIIRELYLENKGKKDLKEYLTHKRNVDKYEKGEEVSPEDYKKAQDYFFNKKDKAEKEKEFCERWKIK